MSSETPREKASQPPQPARIEMSYGQMAALYVSQFVLTAGDDELTIDCSSGVDYQAGSQGAQLPIHTRLALPWSTARQLAGLLGHIVRQHDERQNGNGSAPSTAAVGGQEPPRGTAKLPKLGGMNV